MIKKNTTKKLKTSFLPRVTRKLHWISSSTGDSDQLLMLDKNMSRYYSTVNGRESYQAMLDSENKKVFGAHNVGIDLIEYIFKTYKPSNSILEIGCGRGNLFKELVSGINPADYYGMEVAPHIIALNENEFSQSNWRIGTAYSIPFGNHSFDICYSHFVLEHLVFIEKALNEMMRVVKPGGELILIFPDFVELKALPSQYLGYSFSPNAKQKLKQGKFLDAMISLYDSRIRIPFQLKNINKFGPFPVNVNPVCLLNPDAVYPDADAIYIASKNEIAAWATRNHFKIRYPKGTGGQYRTHVFMVIEKTSG